MSISVADNFQYKGGKPLDARMKFATILDMTAAPVADLYDGCFSYVVAEQKYYSYDSNNENDPHLGKWREYSAGAEYSDFTGATSQDAGVHGLVPAPTTADVDKYLKGDGSWGAIEMPNFDYSNEFGAENIYSTTEKMIGQWTDGKPLYQKNLVVPKSGSSERQSVKLNINADYVYAYGFWKRHTSLEGGCMAINASDVNINYVTGWYYDKENDELCFTYGETVRNFLSEAYVTIRYTKTTDSAMSIGTPNDYSTTEKIVGTWTDGKPVYQKTIDCGALPNKTSKNVPIGNVSIDTVVSINGISKNASTNENIPLPYVHPNAMVIVDVRGTNTSSPYIFLYGLENMESYSNSSVTIQYTKTTD